MRPPKEVYLQQWVVISRFYLNKDKGVYGSGFKLRAISFSNTEGAFRWGKV
jgi:hypothetical protein